MKDNETVEAETEAPAAEPVKAKVKRKAKAKAKPAKAKPAKPAKAKKAKAPVKLDVYGLRDGSVKSKAAAMYASGKGATLNEVKKKLGSVQLNVLTELALRGHKVKQVKEAGEGNRKITRYHLTIKK